jgi:hypothetical protein
MAGDAPNARVYGRWLCRSPSAGAGVGTFRILARNEYLK